MLHLPRAPDRVSVRNGSTAEQSEKPHIIAPQYSHGVGEGIQVAIPSIVLVALTLHCLTCSEFEAEYGLPSKGPLRRHPQNWKRCYVVTLASN